MLYVYIEVRERKRIISNDRFFSDRADRFSKGIA